MTTHDESAPPQPTLLVVGGGRMGTALVRGLLSAGWRAPEVAVVERSEARRAQLVAELPDVTVVAQAPPTEGAVLAVKPADARVACGAVAGSRRVLSIMAGVTLGDLQGWLAPGTAVVRAMPNTPATVGAGVSAVAGGTHAGEADLVWAERLLGAVGVVVRLPESDLDAVTGLSGSGPAYVFFLAEALAAVGEAEGLAPEMSRLLASATVAGAGRLLAQSGQTPEALRAQVTSPGGTTEVGVGVLEARGVRAAVAAAVAAAAARSRVLGGAGPGPREG